MQLSCPNCATSYEVKATTLGEAGRSVRCTRCRTIWQAAASPVQVAAETIPPHPNTATDAAIAVFQQELGALVNPASGTLAGGTAPEAGASLAQTAAGAETDAAPDIETAAAAASIADQPIDLDAMAEAKIPDATTPDSMTSDSKTPVSEAAAPEPPTDEVPPLVPQSSDGEPPTGQVAAPIELLANQRRRRPVRRPTPASPMRNRTLAVAILVLLAAVSALIGLRTEVVRRAPQMASLYAAIGMPVNLRKLIFTDVRIAREVHEGVPVLLVEGTIVSTSSTPVDVPRLRFAVRNGTGSEVYTWTALPSQSKIAPFDSLGFQSRIASPPGDGHDVVVRFFNRHDVVANLH